MRSICLTFTPVCILLTISSTSSDRYFHTGISDLGLWSCKLQFWVPRLSPKITQENTLERKKTDIVLF